MGFLGEQVDTARDTEKEYVLEFEFLMKYARKSGARPGVPTHFFLTPVLHRLAEIAEILEVGVRRFCFRVVVRLGPPTPPPGPAKTQRAVLKSERN